MSSTNVSIKDVMSHYNIVGLAIGVAVGVAGKDLVFSLSDDVILPLIGKVIKLKFFQQYNFEWEKLVSSLLTFSLVMGVIVLLLYFALRPFVSTEISGNKKYNNTITNSLKTIVTYQEDIKKDLDTLEKRGRSDR